MPHKSQTKRRPSGEVMCPVCGDKPQMGPGYELPDGWTWDSLDPETYWAWCPKCDFPAKPDRLASAFSMRRVESASVCGAAHRFETDCIPPSLELRCLCGARTWGEEYNALVDQALKISPKWLRLNLSSRFILHG